jgi:CelD/BcsL family acetyltransferase involved in cellulose biosynthesis
MMSCWEGSKWRNSVRKSVAYKVIRTTRELDGFAPLWSALWQDDPQATPFQSPEWLLPWWHQFGQPELRAVVISQDARLIGFLPFYIYQEPDTGERQLLLLGVGTTDYLDGIFSPACTQEYVQAALDLACTEKDWDILSASQLRPPSMLFQALQSAGLSIRHFDGESCSRMPAVRMAELPQKIRRNAMYYRNRAMRLGKLELTVANESNWAASFDALQRLHTTRWEDCGQPGVLADQRVIAWHREAVPRLQRGGMLRLSSLSLNGETIGVLYSLIDPPSRPMRTQYFYLTAYSTGHAELRPGTLLLAFAIERAAEEGVRTIDMLRGDEAYKQIWHMERVPTYGFAISPAEPYVDVIRVAGATA